MLSLFHFWPVGAAFGSHVPVIFESKFVPWYNKVFQDLFVHFVPQT